MEVPLRDGLAWDGHASAAERSPVGGHLDRVDLSDAAFEVELDRWPHVARVERGVKRREDEATAGLQEPRGRRHHRLDVLHVHDRHVADDSIERLWLPEREQGVFVDRRQADRYSTSPPCERARSSMPSLKSTASTCAPRPDIRRANSPFPHAISRTRSPGSSRRRRSTEG